MRRSSSNPGVRMVGERPAARSSGPVRRLPIVVGKAYTARKGSYLRVQFGPGAVYMVLAAPPIVTHRSVIQVLGPRGMTLCNATDLRPCEDPEDTD